MPRFANKAKDLYRGLCVDEDVQRRVLRGEVAGVHPSTVAVIHDIGIVAPKGLRKPERCKCGALLIAKPCVRCQIEELR